MKYKEDYITKTYPLISIVTIVYNGERHIEETIQSVISQTYKNIEYIIIDGGSTDGTVDIIKKYEEKIDYWVSEPDEGIYDAMNKGSKYATGDFINFLNAGDKFLKEEILEDIVLNINDKSKVHFGRALIQDEQVSWLYPEESITHKSIDKWLHNNLPNHQAMFFPKIFYKEYQYIIKYKIGADSDYKFESQKVCGFLFIDKVIVEFKFGGISTSFASFNVVKQILKDTWSISRKHKGIFYAFNRVFKNILKYMINLNFSIKLLKNLLSKWRS